MVLWLSCWWLNEVVSWAVARIPFKYIDFFGDCRNALHNLGNFWEYQMSRFQLPTSKLLRCRQQWCPFKKRSRLRSVQRPQASLRISPRKIKVPLDSPSLTLSSEKGFRTSTMLFVFLHWQRLEGLKFMPKVHKVCGGRKWTYRSKASGVWRKDGKMIQVPFDLVVGMPVAHFMQGGIALFFQGASGLFDYFWARAIFWEVSNPKLKATRIWVENIGKLNHESGADAGFNAGTAKLKVRQKEWDATESAGQAKYWMLMLSMHDVTPLFCNF